MLKPPLIRFNGTSSGTSVLVSTSQYQGFGTRFSGGYLHFSHFGTSSILAPNQVEPKDLVLKLKLSGT